MPMIRMPGPGFGYPLLAIPLLVAVGCGAPEGGTGEVVVRDSAGVSIVDNQRPEWTQGEGWIIDSIPEVVIRAAGSDGERDLLYVRDIVRMTNGDLVVANAGLSELDVFDSTGRFLRSIDRAGRGPGEFDWMLGMMRCGGDTLVVNQGAFVSVFDPQGGFVETRMSSKPPGAGGANQVFGVTRDCGAFLMWGMAQGKPPLAGTVYRPEAFLFWAGLGTTTWDSVAVTPGPTLVSLSALGSVFGIAVPFGGESVWATHGDETFVGDTDHPEIRIYNKKRGLRTMVRWQASARPLGPADRRAYDGWRDDILERNPEEPRDLFPPSNNLPWPGSRPLFAGVLVDEKGTLWIREFPPAPSGRARLYTVGPDGAPEPWWVIDSTGRWLGSVTMPRGLEVKQIQEGRILGVARNTDGVEEVRIYRIGGNRE